LDDLKCPENRASASFSSDAKLSSTRDSESRLFKLNYGDISPNSEIEKKEPLILEENFPVLIPDSKLQMKEMEIQTERKSLTPISIESKHTNKSSELSEQRYSIFEQRSSTSVVEKESTRKQNIKRYAKLIAQGCESPVPSNKQADDKAPNGRIVKHLLDDNIHQRNRQHPIQPLSLENLHNKVDDGILDSRMFSISQAQKPSKRDTMIRPRGYDVEKELRETQEPPICFAQV